MGSAPEQPQAVLLNDKKTILSVEKTTSANGCGLFPVAFSRPASACPSDRVSRGVFLSLSTHILGFLDSPLYGKEIEAEIRYLYKENAMKKRTVKDFIALYAPEDEEKLVLIQSGTSADKTFLDTFWTAHTHAIAMADVQTGQVLSGRCYLNWPLTDKERDAGDYSKRFAKGQIYRIKARGWKGDSLSEPQWYVTEVLEECVPCPALEQIWAEYTNPILLEDEVLGTLTLDREMSMFNGTCRWMGKDVQISLDVEIEKKASWTRVTNVMKKLVADQEAWDKSLRAMAAQKLTPLANEWLADNDQTDRDPETDPITEDEFARRILLTEFTVSPGGRFTAWYEDDDMFWGHVITVDGTLKKGPVNADIQG